MIHKISLIYHVIKYIDITTMENIDYCINKFN
jgi:hypothetical protein